jgi:hypothetical protein
MREEPRRLRAKLGTKLSAKPRSGLPPAPGLPHVPRPPRAAPYAVRRRTASQYFSRVFSTTSGGNAGAGGSLFHLMASR